MKSKFPQHLFISVENEGSKDQFFQANKTILETAEQGLTKQVARYELVATMEVGCVPNVKGYKDVKRK